MASRPGAEARLVASTGFKFAGTGAHVAGAGADWVNPGNVTADDNANAQTAETSGGTTDKLRATNFDFSVIPNGAVINGSESRVRRLRTGGGSIAVSESYLQLVNSGVNIGSTKTDVGDWATVEEVATEGGALDGWSASLTSAIVKSSGFGVDLWLLWGAGIPTPESYAEVDSVEMNVHYTVAFFAMLAFRWRNDDGNETGATWAGALNTDIECPIGGKRRLRLETEEQAGGDLDVGFTLQVSHNGAAYGDISAATAAVLFDSANFVDGADCTQQLATSLKTFDADNDGMQDSGSISTDKGPYPNVCFEHEWAVMPNAAVVSVGSTVDFRERTSGVLDSYADFPRMTVIAAGGSQGGLLLRGC